MDAARRRLLSCGDRARGYRSGRGRDRRGEILLNYVSPDARFRGASAALLAAMEARAVERGATRCTLTSTETARRFYRARGYEEIGPPSGKFGMDSGYPMSKALPRGAADV
jgi:GNAT superfamily N-acetyltransferase